MKEHKLLQVNCNLESISIHQIETENVDFENKGSFPSLNPCQSKKFVLKQKH